MIMRRETDNDISGIRAVTAAAFRGAEHSAPPVTEGGDPGEVTLIDWLRADPQWIPELSIVAVADERIVGHIVASGASIGGTSAVGIGPVSVLPELQGTGIGSALMNYCLGAADALGIAAAALLGDPHYYSRFGFVPAASMGINAPDPEWGDFFQARALSTYAGQQGPFRYAAPFNRL